MSENLKDSSVLVVGSTGLLGMEICRQLTKAGKNVKALVRPSSDYKKVTALKEMGAEIREGDLKNISSIRKAIEGVSYVISTASSTFSRQEGDSIESVDRDGQSNLVKIAGDAGVKQFIFISFSPMPLEFSLQTAKRNTEKLLKESKMNYTILQPGFFMEVWLSPAVGFDLPQSKATIYGNGKNKLHWISLKDVAAFAVASLNNEAVRDSVCQLGGPEALSPLEVVRIFEKQTGNSFTTEYVPLAALQARKAAATDSFSESFAALMLMYAQGDNIDTTETRKVYPFRMISVADYAQTFKAEHKI
jgi:NADH dehydrogenase